MAQLTAAQAQTIIDQSLQTGDEWRSILPGYFNTPSAANLAQLNNILAQLAPFFSSGMQSLALVRAIATVRGWGVATTDAQKLLDIAAGVGSVLGYNATTAATASVPSDSRVGSIGQHIGMGGQLIGALAALT